MSDTPRMDKVALDVAYGPHVQGIVDEGKRLERELAAVTAERAALWVAMREMCCAELDGGHCGCVENPSDCPAVKERVNQQP